MVIVVYWKTWTTSAELPTPQPCGVPARRPGLIYFKICFYPIPLLNHSVTNSNINNPQLNQFKNLITLFKSSTLYKKLYNETGLELLFNFWIDKLNDFTQQIKQLKTQLLNNT
jgi:hypothetical protein